MGFVALVPFINTSIAKQSLVGSLALAFAPGRIKREKISLSTSSGIATMAAYKLFLARLKWWS